MRFFPLGLTPSFLSARFTKTEYQTLANKTVLKDERPGHKNHYVS